MLFGLIFHLTVLNSFRNHLQLISRSMYSLPLSFLQRCSKFFEYTWCMLVQAKQSYNYLITACSTTVYHSCRAELSFHYIYTSGLPSNYFILSITPWFLCLLCHRYTSFSHVSRFLSSSDLKSLQNTFNAANSSVNCVSCCLSSFYLTFASKLLRK